MTNPYIIISAKQTQEEAHDEWLENTTKLIRMFITALPTTIPEVEANATIQQKKKNWFSSTLTSTTLSEGDTQRANDVFVKAMKETRENIYHTYRKGSAMANAVCELSYALFEELRLELETGRTSFFGRIFSKKKLSEKSKQLLSQYTEPLELATNLTSVNLDGMTVYVKYFILIMLASLEERYGINKMVNDYWDHFPYLLKKFDGKFRIEGDWNLKQTTLLDANVRRGYRFNLYRFMTVSSDIALGFNRKIGQYVETEGLPYVDQLITHEYNHCYLFAVALKLYVKLYGDTETIDDDKYHAVYAYVNRKLMQMIKDKVAAQLKHSQKAGVRMMFGGEWEGSSLYATKNPYEYLAEAFTIAMLTPSAKRNVWGKVSFEFLIQGPDNLAGMLQEEIKKNEEEFNEHMSDYKAGEEGTLLANDPKCDPVLLRSKDFGYIGSDFEKDSPEDLAIREKIMRVRNCSFPGERIRKLKRLAACLNVLDEIKKKAPDVYNQYTVAVKMHLKEKNRFVKYLLDHMKEIKNVDTAKKTVDAAAITNLVKLIKDNLDVLADKFGTERDDYLQEMLQAEIRSLTIQPSNITINPNELEISTNSISTNSISTDATDNALTSSQNSNEGFSYAGTQAGV